METISLQLVTNRTQRRTLQGREYIVAPASILIHGVLNGSQGAMYYSSAENQRSAPLWQGIPIVLNHPQVSGKFVSARHPGVYEQYGMGFLSQPRLNPSNDKLQVHTWFDVEYTRRIAPDVLDSLERGEPIEVSTGLFTENTPVENAVFQGRKGPQPYKFIARNYIPDHLAVLTNERGACSRSDGCGVLVNTETCSCSTGEPCAKCKKKAPVSGVADTGDVYQDGKLVATNTFATGDVMVNVTADSGGGHWVTTDDDQHLYLSASGGLHTSPGGEQIGQAKGTEKKAEAPNTSETIHKAFNDAIRFTAYKHDQLVDLPFLHQRVLKIHPSLTPKQFQEGLKSAEKAGWTSQGKVELHYLNETGKIPDPHGVMFNRDDKQVGYIHIRPPKDAPKKPTANYSGFHSKADQQRFYQLTTNSKSTSQGDIAMTRDEAINVLTTNCDCWKGSGDRDVLNTFSDDRLFSLAGDTVALNAYKVKKPPVPPAGVEEEMVDSATLTKKKTPMAPACNEVTTNAAGKQQPQTPDEWLASAPPEVQQVVMNALRRDNQEKATLINRMVANVADPQRKAALQQHLAGINRLDELQLLSELMASSTPTANQQQGFGGLAPSFFGNGTPVTLNQGNGVEEEPLRPLTINWAEK